MSKPLSPQAQKVQDAIANLGYPNKVVEFEQTTRSAQEAADAIGVELSQIVKSILFKTRHSNRPVMVVASGPNRINEKKVKNLVEEPIEKADADFVREKTGYTIGGVPPLGHKTPITIFIDEDLWQHDEIWAAAGTPNAVFPLTPHQLLEMTGGQMAHIKKDQP